jgi:uncharacterized protein YchJ
MQAQEFLEAELQHAERQLVRVRRIAALMQADLEAAGLDEVAVYEKLAAHKAYRQLQRDEVTYQQVWLRVHRHLTRLAPPAQPKQTENAIPFDQAMAALRHVAESKPQPYRKPPTPGPNQPCLCGSGVKYKKCCGNPLRQAA